MRPLFLIITLLHFSISVLAHASGIMSGFSDEDVSGSTPDEIADALKRLYEFFIKIGYVTEEQMKWPPHTAADLDVEFCKAQGLDEGAINLLRKIPWTTADVRLEVDDTLINYSTKDGIVASRYPDFPWGGMDEVNYLVPGNYVPLNVGVSVIAEIVFVDTRHGNRYHMSLAAPDAHSDSGTLFRGVDVACHDGEPEPEPTHNPVDTSSGSSRSIPVSKRSQQMA